MAPMLSVILYGRNDSYGYNIHKRAAISLNCIAELLTAPRDEIIFVDYNTPDDFPTFPEAIQDTLTDRAKALLRILRVRPSQHERFRERTELVALEPIARNIAIRRSNPDNRWILSTNTDMVFVPRCGASLSEIVMGLPDAYYHLPRFEIPEPLWESLDRLDPVADIAAICAWGREFHLNEIAFLKDPVIKYDAPGDFQLVLRSDLWQMQGFNESMLLGWHVDSNIAKRLSLLPRRIGDIVDDVFGYHCDHTRQLTQAHRHRSKQNDWQTFIEDVVSPHLPDQAGTWGLAGESVEELKIHTTSRLYLDALRSAISFPLAEPTELRNFGKIEARIDYSAEHVIPFLAAIFASYPRGTILGWLGAKKSLLWRFATVWKVMGFFEQILVSKEARWLGPDLPPSCTWATDGVLDEHCEVFAFDFGMLEGEYAAQGWESDAVIDEITSAFRRMVRQERLRLVRDRTSPRRFIGVNTTVRIDVKEMFNEDIAAATTPDATRIKHGFVCDARGPRDVPQDVLLPDQFDCMPMLTVGAAGARGPMPALPHCDAIHAKLGIAGILAYGPYVSLPPGHYEAAFEFYAEPGAALSIDVATNRGELILAQERIKTHSGVRGRGHGLKMPQEPLTRWLGFEIGADVTRGNETSIEFRVWSTGKSRFCLLALRIRQIVVPSQKPEKSAHSLAIAEPAADISVGLASQDAPAIDHGVPVP